MQQTLRRNHPIANWSYQHQVNRLPFHCITISTVKNTRQHASYWPMSHIARDSYTWHDIAAQYSREDLLTFCCMAFLFFNLYHCFLKIIQWDVKYNTNLIATICNSSLYCCQCCNKNTSLVLNVMFCCN